MGFWKFSPFLVLSILALYHMGALQAAPLRSALENPRGPPALTDDQICLLLTAMLNDYVGLKVCQLEQNQKTEGSRSALENPGGPPALTDDQICLLLTAMLNDYVHLKVRQLEQDQETEGSSLDSLRAKRCSNLSTCVLGTYTQDLNKLHTFPQTAIGVGAPGKKRVVANSLERDHSPHMGMIWDAYQSSPSAL